MSAAAFDTLSAARDLEAAGIERAHAEAIARTIGRSDERSATLSWPISSRPRLCRWISISIESQVDGMRYSVVRKSRMLVNAS